MRLSDLSPGMCARVAAIEPTTERDPIARRLLDLGFVAGEPIRVVARGPIGGEPLAVQVGSTRFALRLSEAARVRIECEAAAA